VRGMQTQGENVMASAYEIKMMAKLIIKSCDEFNRNYKYLRSEKTISAAMYCTESMASIDALLKSMQQINYLDRRDADYAIQQIINNPECKL
jgi:hypothetical protein